MKNKAEIYQIKVTLNDVQPPVWRELLVPSTYTLTEFHDVLQIAMGWSDSHLHEFVASGKHYGPADADTDMDVIDESTIKLDEIMKKAKDTITYEYDFGDSWQHKIVLLKLLENDGNHIAPSCIDGARACPPEDCGGVWGYQHLLEALADSSHPEHEEMLEWLGEEFDSEFFDASEINAMLE